MYFLDLEPAFFSNLFGVIQDLMTFGPRLCVGGREDDSATPLSPKKALPVQERLAPVSTLGNVVWPFQANLSEKKVLSFMPVPQKSSSCARATISNFHLGKGREDDSAKHRRPRVSLTRISYHLLCMGGRADDSARTIAPPLHLLQTCSSPVLVKALLEQDGLLEERVQILMRLYFEQLFCRKRQNSCSK